MYKKPDATPLATREEGMVAEGRVSLGMQWLDVILNGGVPANRMYLLKGAPGTGKTTLGLQFLIEGIVAGEKCMIVTLSETKSELESVAASHGMDEEFKKIEVFEVHSGDAVLPDGQKEYTAFSPAEIELGASIKSLVEKIREVKPTRVVIDSLSEMRLLARESVRYRRQMAGLKNFFIERQCTVLLIDEPASPDQTVDAIVSGVICLERSTPEYGRDRRRLQIVKMRGVEFYGGFHDYEIRKGGMVVWPRLVASNHSSVNHDHRPVSSGVNGIDGMMDGGPLSGTAMLLIGSAGSGKSSLAIQYCIAGLNRDESAALFAFDERLDTIHIRSESMGCDLKPYQKNGKMIIEQIDPGVLSPGEFIQRVRSSVEVSGAKTVVIDSLNGYLTAMPGEQSLVLQMHELLTYLSQKGVLAILIVAQNGVLSADIVPPVDMSYLADTVLALRYFEFAGQVRKTISVVKKRGGVHENTLRELIVSARGVQVGPQLTEFQGILRGAPAYLGDVNRLVIERQGPGTTAKSPSDPSAGQKG